MQMERKASDTKGDPGRVSRRVYRIDEKMLGGTRGKETDVYVHIEFNRHDVGEGKRKVEEGG